MNERIRELALQAGVQEDLVDNLKDEVLTYIARPQDIQKFAESVVMECLRKIDGLIIPETFEQSIGPYEKWNQALGHAALEIEQHFFGDQHGDQIMEKKHGQ